MRYISLSLLLLLALTSCEKDQTKIDDKIIREYLEENNLEADLHSSGLYYKILDEGTGGRPDIFVTVEVKYKGYLTNGEVFDETTGDDTLESPLSSLIQGWQIGIPLMKRGGKGIFYIPSELGYGDREVGPIPANSVLIFEIELISFY